MRPERISLEPRRGRRPAPAGHNAFHGLVDRVVYLGPTTHVVVRLADGQTLLVAVPNTGEPLSSPFVVGRAGAGDASRRRRPGCSPATRTRPAGRRREAAAATSGRQRPRGPT